MQKKLKLHTALAVLLMGLVACQSANSDLSSTDTELPGEGRSVKPGQSTLLEDNFPGEIVNIGLEQLGYQIEPAQQLEPTTMHVSIANGELDYTTMHFEKVHAKFFENAGGEDKIQRVGTILPNIVRGYQIDKKTAEQYNITNIEQLKAPEIARLFDHDNDGKANLAGANPGWGSGLVINHHLEAYRLGETVEHDQGQYTVLLADVLTRYKQGQSVLYYTWTPYWLPAVLKPGEDVVWLEVPYTNLPREQGNLTEKDTSVDGKNFGFPIDRRRIIANNEFLANNPAAERLFELVQIPLGDTNAQQKKIQEGENAAEDVRRHAQEWVNKNRDLFDSWLAEAREAAR